MRSDDETATDVTETPPEDTAEARAEISYQDRVCIENALWTAVRYGLAAAHNCNFQGEDMNLRSMRTKLRERGLLP